MPLADPLPLLPPSPALPRQAVEELTAECLGHAGLVYEHVLGEDKFTFVEDVRHPHSCTILIKGPNDYTIAQVGRRVPGCVCACACCVCVRACVCVCVCM